jgi:hypothetical protein
MTTDVGHRLRRRGRKGGAKRRTPRAAVAAGALAAASIPLWPSAADAGPGAEQYKYATQTVNVQGVSCTFEATSLRSGDWLYGRTSVSDRPECRSTLSVEVTYVALRRETQYDVVSAYGRNPGVEVTATGAQNLTRSLHRAHFSGCDCDISITLDYSSK